MRTASTTSAANCLAMLALSLVARDVCATPIKVARSNVIGRLKVSKNWNKG